MGGGQGYIRLDYIRRSTGDLDPAGFDGDGAGDPDRGGAGGGLGRAPDGARAADRGDVRGVGPPTGRAVGRPPLGAPRRVRRGGDRRRVDVAGGPRREARQRAVTIVVQALSPLGRSRPVAIRTSSRRRSPRTTGQ